MFTIYRDSFRFFLSSFPVLLAMGATIEALLWFLQPTTSASSGTAVALIILAYFFHRHFLFGETLLKPNVAKDAPPQKFGWFLFISCLILVPTVVIVIALIAGMGGNASDLSILLAFALAYLLALSLFGTALPAAVARDGTYRLSQGLRATFSTMWRLVLGPGVVGAILFIVTSFADHALSRSGIAADSLVVLAFYVLIRTAGFLTTICAVAVLCDIYRKTRPHPSASADQTSA